ncbi:MAG: alpha/beta fold hydrolase [Blastocatellia bacterium]
MKNSPRYLCALFWLIVFAVANAPTISAQQRPARPRSRYVEANGIRIHYLEWAGKGTPIVLVHGLYDTSEVWSVIAPRLAVNHRVLAIDRRGSGLTGKPADGYDHTTLASDLAAFIETLQLGSVILVAHSFGGEIAMTFAASNPNALQALALIEGGFFPKPEAAPAGALPSPPCKAKPPVCARLALLEKAISEYDAEAIYPRVTAPTLVVIGEPAKISAAQAELVKQGQRHAATVADRKLPRGKMAVIKNANHWVQKDQPRELAKVVEDFLASVK